MLEITVILLYCQSATRPSNFSIFSINPPNPQSHLPVFEHPHRWEPWLQLLLTLNCTKLKLLNHEGKFSCSLKSTRTRIEENLSAERFVSDDCVNGIFSGADNLTREILIKILIGNGLKRFKLWKKRLNLKVTDTWPTMPTPIAHKTEKKCNCIISSNFSTDLTANRVQSKQTCATDSKFWFSTK